MTIPKKKAAKATAGSSSRTAHVRFPESTIAKLDALATANNTTRAALIQIAVSRILKSGI
jgi:predicted transcriptional regulator